MPFTKSLWPAGLIFLLAAGAGFSQTSVVSVAPSGQTGFVAGFGVATGVGSPSHAVPGMPYSAEQVSERVQTLADGTHITQTMQTTKMYRDSAGRTRTEHILTLPAGATGTASVPVLIEIMDPVAGFRYTLEERNHVARRMAWPPAHAPNMANTQPGINTAPPVVSPKGVMGAAPPASATTAQRPHPEMKHESLGTQTIEGVLADGSRTTVTYPVGFMGNDQPITTVTERWISPDLKIMVLSKTTDPRSGESTTKLTNLSQSEPDPALFQVPADYTVEDAQPVNLLR